jgi:hypothetical protein
LGNGVCIFNTLIIELLFGLYKGRELRGWLVTNGGKSKRKNKGDMNEAAALPNAGWAGDNDQEV